MSLRLDVRFWRRPVISTLRGEWPLSARSDIRDRLLEWPILTQAVIEPNIAVRQNRYDGGDYVTDR